MKRRWVLALIGVAACSGKDAGYEVGTERDYSPRCQLAGAYELAIDVGDKPVRAQLEVGDPMVAFRANPEQDDAWNDDKARSWLRTRMLGALTAALPQGAIGPNEPVRITPDHVRCRMTVIFRDGGLELDVNPKTGAVLGKMVDARGDHALRGHRTPAGATADVSAETS